MHLLVGLGNPGTQYELTRHNVGFLFLDELADAAGGQFSQTKFNSLVCRISWKGHDLLLLKPQTFMNLSGASVLEAVQFFKLTPAQVTVVFDDLDQAAGAVRMRVGGGHGGHNGIRDILARWGQDGFFRLKVGIGKPEHKSATANYVLGRLSTEELQYLKDKSFAVARERLEDILKRS
jgi:PTH1 family peptidyl-tRNA hydrolase